MDANKVMVDGGLMAGVLLFIFILVRDGWRSVAYYFADETDVMSPSGSMVTVSRLKHGYYDKPEPMSWFTIVFGMSVALISSLLMGMVIGVMILTPIAMMFWELK